MRHDDDCWTIYETGGQSDTETLYEKELPVLRTFRDQEGTRDEDAASGEARYLEVSQVK